MRKVDWRWPDGKQTAVVFNLALEAWSDGKAPGISPMGNPLPPGVLDTMAISWAAYGVNVGVYRLLEGFARHGAKCSALVNAIIAERAPEAVKAIADGGHEVLSHSYTMDVVPGLLGEDEQRRLIAQCTGLLEKAAGKKVQGWLSPRGTSGAGFPALLAEAGYRWYGDVFDDDLPYLQTHGGRNIVAIPLGTDVNDMQFMKFGNVPKLMLESFDENLEVARRQGDRPAMIDVTVHAHIFGRPRGAYYYEKIVERAASAANVWIATRAEIADHLLAQNS